MARKPIFSKLQTSEVYFSTTSWFEIGNGSAIDSSCPDVSKTYLLPISSLVWDEIFGIENTKIRLKTHFRYNWWTLFKGVTLLWKRQSYIFSGNWKCSFRNVAANCAHFPTCRDFYRNVTHVKTDFFQNGLNRFKPFSPITSLHVRLETQLNVDNYYFFNSLEIMQSFFGSHAAFNKQNSWSENAEKIWNWKFQKNIQDYPTPLLVGKNEPLTSFLFAGTSNGY